MNSSVTTTLKKLENEVKSQNWKGPQEVQEVDPEEVNQRDKRPGLIPALPPSLHHPKQSIYKGKSL